MNIKQIIKEEVQAALDEETSSPYYAEQARLGKIRQMGHDDAVAGKEPSSTMAIYRVGYQAGMKSKKEKPMSKYDFFKENKMNKTKLKQLVKETLEATINEEESQLVSKHGSDISPWSVAQDLEINKEMFDMSLVTTETSPSGRTIHKLPMDILQGAVETGRLIAQNPELLDYVMNNVQAGDRVMGQRCEDCTSDGDDIMDGKDVLRMVDYATKTADSAGGPASAEEMDRWESDYRDERPSPFSPEDIDKMRSYKSPTQAQKDAWESDYFKENKTNQNQTKTNHQRRASSCAKGKKRLGCR